MADHARAQHVWVSLTGRAEDAVPGLPLEWRPTKQGWQGWVISAQPPTSQQTFGVDVRQSWVPAAAIRPL